jgi:hypothetical protein
MISQSYYDYIAFNLGAMIEHNHHGIFPMGYYEIFLLIRVGFG